MFNFIKNISVPGIFHHSRVGKKEPIRPELHWRILLAVSFSIGVSFFVIGILLYQWISVSDGINQEFSRKDLLLNHSELSDALRVLEEREVKYQDLRRNPILPREPR